MKTVQCPTCFGKKTVNVQVEELGKPTTNMDLTCVVCNGTGTVVESYRDAIVEHLNDWCQCDDDLREHVRYYGDGEHPKLYKHHYRHEPGCGKIVQIG